MELFERWLETCAENHAAWAVRDLGAGGRGAWTFADLKQALESLPRLPAGSMLRASAQEGVVPFLLRTLQAWRDEAVLLPAETGATAEVEGRVPAAGVIHVKTTSGSTAEPRRVEFQASQLAADLEQIWSTMRLSRSEPNLAVISVAHSYGFSNLVLPLLLKGMPMIVLPDPLPGSLQRGLSEAGSGVTLPAVPAMWRAWHRAGLLRGAAVACALTAGAPMPLELEHAIHDEAGLKVHNFYGASECGGIAYDDSESPRCSAEEVGRAMDGVRLSVDEDGCLRVASAAVAVGYEEPDESLGGGVFRTSDLARLEGDRVRLIGRVADTIHVAGRKVAPQVIEAALLRDEAVKHCVVFGVASADAARVEEVVACVHAEGDETRLRAALLKRLSGELSGWQVPRRWWFTRELEPDARGKISRQHWRQRFLERIV